MIPLIFNRLVVNCMFHQEETTEIRNFTYKRVLFMNIAEVLVTLFTLIFFFSGGLRLPASQTGRTIICCWWLFCIILSATYSGNLIAFLTVTKEKTPFDSLTEMVAQSDYEWGTLGGTFWMTFFEVLLWRENYGNNM